LVILAVVHVRVVILDVVDDNVGMDADVIFADVLVNVDTEAEEIVEFVITADVRLAVVAFNVVAFSVVEYIVPHVCVVIIASVAIRVVILAVSTLNESTDISDKLKRSLYAIIYILLRYFSE